MEKAYARLHGGYAGIAAGSTAAALSDLTGGFVEPLDLSTGSLQDSTVWAHIMHTLAGGGIVACEAAQQLQPSVAAAFMTGAPAAASAYGLLPGSPYGVVAAKELPSGTKLLRLHNPWAPLGVWQAGWASDAAEWSAGEGKAALVADPLMAEGLQDPATFWCSLW